MKLKTFWMVIAVLIFIANCVRLIPVSAHNTVLNLNYDSCEGVENGDGMYEMWYILEKDEVCRHISHEIKMIRYCFKEDSEWIPGSYSETVGDEIKNAVANSIERWNNVYIYLHNSNGTITKKKLIDIEQVTPSEEYDLIIIPDTDMESIARTYPYLEQSENPGHYHYSNWIMRINVDWFAENTYVEPTEEDVNWARENVGAHEFGHILGLRDVDYNNICASEINEDHHTEIIMGYGGETLSDRVSAITYKDIAGVAITRGFHTDNDHQWLNAGIQDDGTYKLICSICNGVKNVDSLSGYSYRVYDACDGEHGLSTGNMMAVASYGNKDYYKCKYCRYVAPFDDIVTQNYIQPDAANEPHKYVNTVEGLEYTFYEEHSYGEYLYLNIRSHQRICSCGQTETAGHWVYASDIVNGRYATCQGCNYLLDLNKDLPSIIMSATLVSINGSYILPNGIVVLVDEDVEAYLAGTLQFYHLEDVPVTQ